MSKLRYLKYLMLISVLIIIFCFSNQNGELSFSISEYFERLLGVGSSADGESVFAGILRGIEVRKCAHIFLFFILAVSIYVVIPKRINRYVRALVTVCFGLAGAAFDEVHQLFIAGRTGQMSDVLVDMVGVLTGTVICFVAERIVRHKGQTVKQTGFCGLKCIRNMHNKNGFDKK